MNNLTEILNQAGLRPQVIEDAVTLLQEEVNAKKGASGFAIRKAFQLVAKIEQGGVLRKAVDKLLDRFVEALDPHYQAYLQLDTVDRPAFSDYLAQRDDDAAEAMLSVTDNVRNDTDKKILVKAYDRLRPNALGHVKTAVPGIGRLIQKYAFELPQSA